MSAPRVVTVTPNPAIDWTVTVPGFAAGAVNRATEERSSAAGKGVNVAVSLAAYGCRVAATGFLGRDNAAAFEQRFRETGVGDRFVRIAGSTRVGIKIVDPETQQTTDVNFPGARPSQDDVFRLWKELDALAARRPVFVLAGSLPPKMEAGAYGDFVHKLKECGCAVVLDTSGEPLRLALDAAPQVVKPNVHELEAITRSRLSSMGEILAAARGLLERGVETAVVSMGAEGALFATADGAVMARPPSVRVHSTVGAGDAMVAGLVAARLAGLALDDTARLATAFSVHHLTAGRDGDVDALRTLVSVEAL
jgi:1-phosphofructokinase